MANPKEMIDLTAHPSYVLKLLGALHNTGLSLHDFLVNRTSQEAADDVGGITAEELELAHDWLIAWKRTQSMTRN
jgi:hypothetical protein